MGESFELEQELYIAAPPELVFEFFTKPELLTRWHCVEAQCDPEPGGDLLFNVTGVDTTRGKYLVVDPPHRLVFTWGFERAGNTEVEVTFTQANDGTQLRLVHRGFATSASRNSHTSGWVHYLERLRISAVDDDPGPDSWRKT